ncbi:MULTISPECIES: hypothetical protein [unclassified Cytobacillus]|uniref:hypothetical protein n=1 Tax=unclassified Cytobacillus TaxID=2675268 RepID=UPI00203F5E9E|nr:hypothetical protein [Cytobacillus sp. AMY 15.2]MCM3090655.1 hypothetical protein [Cytobacillus sp. AMY 15.2]
MKEETYLRPLFGSVEYFEEKVKDYIASKQIKKNKNEHVSKIVSQLENEIRYDFTCHTRIKKECLENLYKVSNKASSSALSR